MKATSVDLEPATTHPPARIPGLLWRLAMLLTVAACTLAFASTALGILSSYAGHSTAGTRDSIQYWAAARQLLHHANPYDEQTILPIEMAAGYPAGLPAFIMPNPPTALPLVLPLGLLEPRAAGLLWLALSLACLIASVRLIRSLHGSPPNQVHWLGYTFAPAMSCLLSGQITLFVLFGLTLFLRFHRDRPFIAGLGLWFCLLKPHLFVPFGIALIAWIVYTRTYRLLAGTVTALALSAAAASLLDPAAWAHYSHMMSLRRPDLLFIPCLSVLLRQSLGHTTWLQFLPSAAASLWAFAYFRRHRHHWSWLHHGSLLMLLSVLVAPYTWFMDQDILLPALLHGAYLTRSRTQLGLLALASALIEVAILKGVQLLVSPFYLWTAPAWLAWYLWATHSSKPPASRKATRSPAAAALPA